MKLHVWSMHVKTSRDAEFHVLPQRLHVLLVHASPTSRTSHHGRVLAISLKGKRAEEEEGEEEDVRSRGREKKGFGAKVITQYVRGLPFRG
jgi:hypothetical protein